MMTLEELNEAIIAWADAKGILEKATPLTQAEKTAEEVEELIRAVTKYEGMVDHDTMHDFYLDEIRDAIGDIYVTLVIGLKMRDMPCNYVNEQVAPKNTCDWHVTRIIKCLTAMNCGSRTLEYHTMMVMMDSLKSVAALHSTTLRDCVKQAYDVIAKRTGKMVDGVFVKDQP
jgi:NTP pyrophosphatase (non-canonical NTP hydrolase)